MPTQVKEIEEIIQDYQDHPNYSDIPYRILEGLIKYRDHGVQPGSFLTNVIWNDFTGVIGRADPESMSSIKEIAMFMYNEMPAGSWGCREFMNDWIKQKSA